MRDSLQNLLPPDQRGNYMSLFSRFLQQKQQAQKYTTALESWTEPEPVSCFSSFFSHSFQERVLQREAIPPCPEDSALRRELLDKLVVVRLNGGLGSTMGCHSIPKCAIEVRNGLSFLDLSIRQIEYLNSLHGVDLPIIYLNSFKTHQITTKLIRRYRSVIYVVDVTPFCRRHNLTIHTVLQNCFPRISKTTLMPIATTPFEADTSEEWFVGFYPNLCCSKLLVGILPVMGISITRCGPLVSWILYSTMARSFNIPLLPPSLPDSQ
jgi:UTP--glucose-1-phosphate uridylyltransferase